MGMNISPLKTLVSTDIDEIGEFEFWTLTGSGTVFNLRAYGFGYDEAGDRILYLKRREQDRNDMSAECTSAIPILISWLGFVPSTLALGLTQAFGRTCFTETAFHTFLSYWAMLAVFIILALALTAFIKHVLDVLVGPTEVANLLVECIDIVPSTLHFSVLNTIWLRAVGVGIRNNNIFSGAPAPRNASLVSIGDNVFMSNTAIVGPAVIGDDCILGLKARLRPFSIMRKGTVIAGQTVCRRGTVLNEGAVLVRNWETGATSNVSHTPSKLKFQKVKRFASALFGTGAISLDKNIKREGNQIHGDIPETSMRVLNNTGKGQLSQPIFPSATSHLPYVIPRIIQLAILLAIMAADLALWNRQFKTKFFLIHQPAESLFEFLGLIMFFLVLTLILMPLTMILAKWVILGKWRQQDPKQYFAADSWVCRQYFAFMCCAIWLAVRQLWQPRFYGTRLQNLWYRLLGSKIGKDVLIFSNGVEDYDNLVIEDEAAVCHGCFALGHLFEGQGMCFADIVIGKGATILSDRQLWPGAVIAPYSEVHGSGAPIRGMYPPPPKPKAAKELRLLKFNEELFVGKVLCVQGSGQWWSGDSYKVTVVDIRESDKTVKVRFSDGGYKRLPAAKLCELVCEEESEEGEAQLDMDVELGLSPVEVANSPDMIARQAQTQSDCVDGRTVASSPEVIARQAKHESEFGDGRTVVSQTMAPIVGLSPIAESECGDRVELAAEVDTRAHQSVQGHSSKKEFCERLRRAVIAELEQLSIADDLGR
jgi:acetyltransferase-like isoleucine patch superfamily enzyme